MHREQLPAKIPNLLNLHIARGVVAVVITRGKVEVYVGKLRILGDLLAQKLVYIIAHSFNLQGFVLGGFGRFCDEGICGGDEHIWCGIKSAWVSKLARKEFVKRGEVCALLKLAEIDVKNRDIHAIDKRLNYPRESRGGECTKKVRDEVCHRESFL